jgi:LysM repeat protein
VRHVVEHGETLRQIADQYGSSISAFIGANPDMDPDRISPGQRLVIPAAAPAGTDSGEDTPEPPPPPEPEPPSPAPARPAPPPLASVASGSKHVVQPGESLKGIAAHYEVTLSDLIAANEQLADPDVIRVGRLIHIPGRDDGSGDSPTLEPVDVDSGDGSAASREDWSAVPVGERILYVMESLTGHGYVMNAAAGIVGNLTYESGVLPNRIERSAPETPMRSVGFDGAVREFSADEIMRRDQESGVGPRKAGVGLAQWTWRTRRRRLFEHAFQGRVLGPAILFDMDAQVDYLVHELRTSYRGVERVLTDPAVTVEAASDEVLYNFETPGSVIGPTGKLPRTDPAVQAVFVQRRALSRQALDVYLEAHPA